MTPLTEKLVILGSFAKASPTKIKNTCCFKCNCQKKPGRGHGSRLADSFQIPTTDNLSHMIKNSPFLSGFGYFACEQCQIWRILCKLFYLAYLLPVSSVFSIYVNHLRFDTFVFTWWIIMYAPILLPMKIHCSVYFLGFCYYLFFSAAIAITESFLNTSSTTV